jgi:hypothetical protein
MTASTPLDGEIDILRTSLENDPRYTRLKTLERLREEYRALPSFPTYPQPDLTNYQTVANPFAPESDARTPGRRRSPEREEALREARSFLSGKTEPTRITDIDDYLGQKGIRLGGNDPLNNLSALLSTSGQFVAHGRAGWTLSQ